jgi:prophage regulatory protein
MPSKYTSTKYLSFKELQSKLGGRGRTTLYKDVELGRLPKPMKIGARLYWNEAEIDAVLEKGAA